MWWIFLSFSGIKTKKQNNIINIIPKRVPDGSFSITAQPWDWGGSAPHVPGCARFIFFHSFRTVCSSSRHITHSFISLIRRNNIFIQSRTTLGTHGYSQRERATRGVCYVRLITSSPALCSRWNFPSQKRQQTTEREREDWGQCRYVASWYNGERHFSTIHIDPAQPATIRMLRQSPLCGTHTHPRVVKWRATLNSRHGVKTSSLSLSLQKAKNII